MPHGTLTLKEPHQADIDPRPGRFLLTGSARLLGLHDIPDLLPGRAETIELSPLSQGEIDGSPDGFVEALFRYGVNIRVPSSDLRRDDYAERALRGGYPEAVRRTDPGRRARLLESYITDLVNRDVRQLSEIEPAADMRRLANLVAASTASLAVPAAIASRLGDQLVAGTVLYAGGQPLPFGDRLRAWPISTLWTLSPDGPIDADRRH